MEPCKNYKCISQNPGVDDKSGCGKFLEPDKICPIYKELYPKKGLPKGLGIVFPGGYGMADKYERRLCEDINDIYKKVDEILDYLKDKEIG